MKSKWNQVNQVEVEGRIESISKTEAGTIVKVASKQGNCARGGVDVSPCFLFKTETDSVSCLKVGARIKVTGYMESFKYQNFEGNWMIGHRLIGVKAEKRKTLCENIFGVDGYYFAQPSVQAMFSGIIKKISEDNGWYRITLSADTDEGKNEIKLNCPKKEFSEMLKVDDLMCCACTMTTKVKETYNKQRMYTDLIIEDLAIVHAA